MARATSPVVGVVLLVALTVTAAATVGAAVTSLEPTAPADRVTLSASADADDDRITFRHEGGNALDVRDLSLSITVDDEPLAHQPPVPYFAAEGFAGTPTGPFNSAADPEWTPGETAALEIASTNDPTLSSGDRVTVRLSTDRAVLTRVRTRAE